MSAPSVKSVIDGNLSNPVVGFWILSNPCGTTFRSKQISRVTSYVFEQVVPIKTDNE